MMILWSGAPRGSVMDREIARLNVTHFRRLLETEKDEAKRKTIADLLAEEEAKLAAMTEERSVRKRAL